jgi:hypothetical protein
MHAEPGGRGCGGALSTAEELEPAWRHVGMVSSDPETWLFRDMYASPLWNTWSKGRTGRGQLRLH